VCEAGWTDYPTCQTSRNYLYLVITI
jgi:hypothetical protein